MNKKINKLCGNEKIKRAFKFIFMFILTYIFLTNFAGIYKTNTNSALIYSFGVTILFVILDTFIPSINVSKKF